MVWPFRKKPEMETRAQDFSLEYMDLRRKGLATGANVTLSATVATAAHYWQSGFAMLDALPMPLPATTLASIGRDLCLKGESCWHIRLDGSELELMPVAYWDELGNGKYHLHIARVNSTETVKALEAEVLKLTINPDPSQPWRGRSPFAMMGLSPVLMAEIEREISVALPMAGKGLLPLPTTISPEERQKALSGLQNGSLAVIGSKADLAVHAGGDRSEIRRVELTPDLQKLALGGVTEDLHHRIMTACGIPPALLTAQGNAGAMREAYRLFALQTITPLARQILPELKKKLAVDAIGIDAMMSADVAGRARAVGVLTKDGVDLEEAMRLAGWKEAKGEHHED